MSLFDAPYALLWRDGERVCAVCGGSPRGRGLPFPPEWWERAFELPGIVWRVPVCRRTRCSRVSLWPVWVALSIYDAQREEVRQSLSRVVDREATRASAPLTGGHEQPPLQGAGGRRGPSGVAAPRS